jgi:hypothetical protein
MSGDGVQSELRHFATCLIEQAGGMVEWSGDERAGVAIAPPEVSASLGQRDESFSIGDVEPNTGLSLGLGGEFIDFAARTLKRFVPAAGAFSLPDLPVRKSDFQQTIDRAFGWQNARARVKQGAQVQVPFHTWWFHVVLHSEDAWETLIRVTVNSNSGLVCDLGEVLESMDLVHVKAANESPSETLDAARHFVEAEALRQAEPFLRRIEQRLDRDRQRLTDYYRALSREAATPNRRTKVVPRQEEIAARQRAVKLELERKLAELGDRFAFDAVLSPMAFAEFQIPCVAIDVNIQRKSAIRTFRIIWNGLTKRIEPLQCSQCGKGAYNFWFTNDDVEPICTACHGA